MIKAIQTQYKGYNFRSRLEARWAVFFDALGIKWEYEAQGYDLGELGYYLPDFWLPEFDCWIEVKPTSEKHNEAFGYLAYFGNYIGPIICTIGTPSMDRGDGFLYCGDTTETGTGGAYQNACKFVWCATCGKNSLLLDDSRLPDRRTLYRTTQTMTPWTGSHCNHGFSAHSALFQAVTAARSARFEHGQSGATTI